MLAMQKQTPLTKRHGRHIRGKNTVGINSIPLIFPANIWKGVYPHEEKPV